MIISLVSKTAITRVNRETSELSEDLLASEEPMEIRVSFGEEGNRSQKSISVTMRTPGNDFELAIGFLFTEGIIKKSSDILSIRYCNSEVNHLNQNNIIKVALHPSIGIDLTKMERNFYTTSSCGVCGKASIEAIKTVSESNIDIGEFKVSKSIIFSLPHKLRTQQKVFEYTGGLHACALFDTNGNILMVREDVGRHNALDKLIGASVTKDDYSSNQFALRNAVLLLSGRASFELVQKAAMAGIPIVCAIGAPSGLAVEMAKAFNITLIGFLKENNFNIYTYPERLII